MSSQKRIINSLLKLILLRMALVKCEFEVKEKEAESLQKFIIDNFNRGVIKNLFYSKICK